MVFPYKAETRPGWLYAISTKKFLPVYWPSYKGGDISLRQELHCGDSIENSLTSAFDKKVDLKGSILLCKECGIENGFLW